MSSPRGSKLLRREARGVLFNQRNFTPAADERMCGHKQNSSSLAVLSDASTDCKVGSNSPPLTLALVARLVLSRVCNSQFSRNNVNGEFRDTIARSGW